MDGMIETIGPARPLVFVPGIMGSQLWDQETGAQRASADAAPDSKPSATVVAARRARAIVTRTAGGG